MIYLQRVPFLLALCLMLGIASAQADDAMIIWPAGWEVETLPPSTDQNATTTRQRAAKNDENGDPLMVVELTRSPLQPGHQVSLQAVLLEMRKAMQINFMHGGYQSACTPIHPGTLGNLPAFETTCIITQNGGQVLKQTLVAATSKGTAYSLSYAGSIEGYKANEAEVQRIRDSLKLGE